MKSTIREQVLREMDFLMEIVKYLYENPEVSGKESFSSQYLIQKLSERGFLVEAPFLNIEHSFRAEYDSGKEGASIAFFCEYDALPDIGHGCGHNLISAMSIGAILALRPLLERMGGKIVLFGTPAEETSGAKVEMADLGAFDSFTAAMMVHPSSSSEESGGSSALYPLEISYYGKAAHAAMAPEKGINALDALILLFNSLYALKNRYTNDVNIHGIITEGGLAPNIIPDFAQAHFYLRASQKSLLDEVRKEIEQCALGAASMTKARVEIKKFEAAYDDLKTNTVLSRLFTENLRELGEEEIKPPTKSLGSIDMGNVSYRVPSIHPWIGIGDESLVIHTKEFAKQTISEGGKDCLFKGAAAMAMTAFEVISNKNIQKCISKEFLSSN